MSISEVTWLDRLHQEHADLKDRTRKLSDFLGSDAFEELPHAEQDDLDHQCEIMRAYLGVLIRRLKRAEPAPVLPGEKAS
jgi:ATP/maltotriose-dependent transcriptional regulator MalT